MKIGCLYIFIGIIVLGWVSSSVYAGEIFGAVRVFEEKGTYPISDIYVSLLDGNQKEIAGNYTNSNGEFLIKSPVEGQIGLFALKIQLISKFFVTIPLASAVKGNNESYTSPAYPLKKGMNELFIHYQRDSQLYSAFQVMRGFDKINNWYLKSGDRGQKFLDEFVLKKAIIVMPAKGAFYRKRGVDSFLYYPYNFPYESKIVQLYSLFLLDELYSKPEALKNFNGVNLSFLEDSQWYDKKIPNLSSIYFDLACFLESLYQRKPKAELAVFGKYNESENLKTQDTSRFGLLACVLWESFLSQNTFNAPEFAVYLLSNLEKIKPADIIEMGEVFKLKPLQLRDYFHGCSIFLDFKGDLGKKFQEKLGEDFKTSDEIEVNLTENTSTEENNDYDEPVFDETSEKNRSPETQNSKTTDIRKLFENMRNNESSETLFVKADETTKKNEDLEHLKAVSLLKEKMLIIQNREKEEYIASLQENISEKNEELKQNEEEKRDLESEKEFLKNNIRADDKIREKLMSYNDETEIPEKQIDFLHEDFGKIKNKLFQERKKDEIENRTRILEKLESRIIASKKREEILGNADQAMRSLELKLGYAVTAYEETEKVENNRIIALKKAMNKIGNDHPEDFLGLLSEKVKWYSSFADNSLKFYQESPEKLAINRIKIQSKIDEFEKEINSSMKILELLQSFLQKDYKSYLVSHRNLLKTMKDYQVEIDELNEIFETNRPVHRYYYIQDNQRKELKEDFFNSFVEFKKFFNLFTPIETADKIRDLHYSKTRIESLKKTFEKIYNQHLNANKQDNTDGSLVIKAEIPVISKMEDAKISGSSLEKPFFKDIRIQNIPLEKVQGKFSFAHEKIQDKVIITGIFHKGDYDFKNIIVSIDGGENWNFAEGMSRFYYEFKPQLDRHYPILIKARDSKNRVMELDFPNIAVLVKSTE